MYICEPHIIWCLQSPEEALDPLELAFQTVVSHHAGAGN